MQGRSVIWRRLDGEGADACRYLPGAGGWEIAGTAVFVAEGTIAHLAYRLTCSPGWTSLAAEVRGWIGSREIAIELMRTPDGGWRSNGVAVDGAAGLVDVDLGFTPASNTNAIRRLAPPVGREIATTAVWLDTEDWTIRPLPQSYRRQADGSFAYASPLHGYRAVLEVDDFGIVTRYPGLWEAACTAPLTAG